MRCSNLQPLTAAKFHGIVKPQSVCKYRTFDTKRAATRAFNEHKVKKDRGTQVMPSEYTFAQWLDYWYDNIIVPQIEETTAYGHQAP